MMFMICLLCLSHAAFCGQTEDAILRGNALIQKKDYDGAIKEYEKALKNDPKNAKAHLLLGLTYANKGDLDKALKFTQYTLMLEKSYAAYQNLGLIYANKGEYQNAIDAYESALKLNPSSAGAWYQLGLVYAASGNFTESITAYKKSIELNPKLDSTYLGLGSAYYWSGNEAAALEQVHQLRLLKMKDKADMLDSWIKNKEAKKKEATAESTALNPAVQDQPGLKPNSSSTVSPKK
jgi:tetratricopeptide (TPR) repeat protein